ncbi:glycosyltransferase [Rufibacter latericius]|uniref:Glycosyltransferase family 2 protein n=1 Tax=Rufibacter latericius TaxID=2487040 RepID=A0A3M9MG65_9BACT|nr:glycosyltransferase [Rufibacter latericius]RNI24550.1 glycosyltransferase family 2 protein [Rufibacter latericius]
MKAGVSIVICTYNGAKLLPETLRHIALQQVRPDVPWEVIIVDNASTDDTARVVKEEWQKHSNPVRFSLLHQAKPGLTFARELGYAHAQYDYILLCDDDNWLSPNYVNLAYDLMEEHPNIGVLGGYGDLVYEEEPPYFATQLRLFANGHQAPESGKVAKNTVYGAGSVLRKSAYDQLFRIGYTPILTDRLASALSSGGDYEICYALALLGYDIWYDERLTFMHFMVKERQTWEYYLRYLKESSSCFEVLDAYNILINQGSRSELTFNYRFIKGFLYYMQEIARLTIQKVGLDPTSEEAKINKLLFLGYKTRLFGYRKYFKVRKNFLQLLQFNNEKLAPNTKPVDESLFPVRKLKHNLL